MRNGHLSIVDSLYLSAREKLLIVRVADKCLLLGVSSQGIHKLNTLDPENVPEGEHPVQHSFVGVINSLKAKEI